MTLLAYIPPDGVEALIEWLKPLGEVTDARPNGAPLPYRVVRRVPGGTSDRISDTGLYTVHTFAADKLTAQEESILTHRRMLYLAGQFTGQQEVTLHDGRVVRADDVVADEWPHEVKWVEDGIPSQIYRFVANYRVTFRYIAVA
ncbi:hypothetical protein JRC04_04835 [Mycolicibacterium sp. S2-37]|uniref:hypothetical protein n=1 Tax=Mycolicibacterium sp. S2-37 TaxID=2810297 RepID=UPI001A95143F|nr:hypothetical protein [Mycolicibacterium sp. S2-37]MBO0676785.1 hypothetical protein [Mycolicibacterium sp. S2-37]